MPIPLTPPSNLKKQQLAAWQRHRTQAARRAVALHWGGNLLLPLLCGLDPRFRDVAGAGGIVLEYLALSMLAAMALFAIVSFSDPGFLPLPALAPLGQEEKEEGRALPLLPVQPLPAAMGAGVLIPETEAAVEEGDDDDQGSCGAWSSSSATTDDDDDDEGQEKEKEEDAATVAADAEVWRLTSPSRAHPGGHRMRAFTVVDPLLGRADVEAAERVPGVREWLRRRHCGVCGLDRLPIRWVILLVVVVHIYIYIYIWARRWMRVRLITTIRSPPHHPNTHSTRHCDACGRCVARFDHHGANWPFPLGHNCVGAGNHVAFVLFLFAQCACLTILLALLLAAQLPACACVCPLLWHTSGGVGNNSSAVH